MFALILFWIMASSFSIQATEETYKEIIIEFSEAKSKLTVKGWNITTKQVVNNENFTKSTSIEIFALDTLTFDEFIDKIEATARVMIIALKWEISPGMSIFLYGATGQKSFDGPAANGMKSRENGAEGMPGSNGTPGGSFYGFGWEFNGLDQFYVHVNGGDGSDGQNGGNGEYKYIFFFKFSDNIIRKSYFKLQTSVFQEPTA